MKLDILSCGAVTSVGLDAFQTAAAFRAGIGGFEGAIVQAPPDDPLRAARVPARRSLRRSPAEWLINLAARAAGEALGHGHANRRVGLILSVPEAARTHPALDRTTPTAFTEALAGAVGRPFNLVAVAGEGGAAIATGFQLADQVMSAGEADACLVGGVDSLVNDRDVARLRKSGRLLETGIQGLIPGEGAAFVLVAPGRGGRALARVCGAATAMEHDHALGSRFSQGRGFEQAMQAACSGSGVSESAISFRVSTVNGEHYAAWEAMFYSSRFYRTRREQLPVWYTASGIGELGAAGGAAAVVLGAFGIAGGYAPGPYAMVEVAAEHGLRGGCILGPAPGAPHPPFRPEEGASMHILQTVRAVARP